MAEKPEEMEFATNVVERSNRFGLLSGKFFRTLSNFKLDIDEEVLDTKDNILGYISTVTLYTGEVLGYVVYIDACMLAA